MTTMMTMQAYPAALERIKKWEAHVRREVPGNFFVVPSTFLALQVQSVVLVSAFVWSVQFDQFFVFLSLLSVPPCPVICKTGGTRPSALWMESTSLSWDSFTPKSIINRLPSGRRISGYANFFATAGKPPKKTGHRKRRRICKIQLTAAKIKASRLLLPFLLSVELYTYFTCGF